MIFDRKATGRGFKVAMTPAHQIGIAPEEFHNASEIPFVDRKLIVSRGLLLPGNPRNRKERTSLTLASHNVSRSVNGIAIATSSSRFGVLPNLTNPNSTLSGRRHCGSPKRDTSRWRQMSGSAMMRGRRCPISAARGELARSVNAAETSWSSRPHWSKQRFNAPKRKRLRESFKKSLFANLRPTDPRKE